MHSFSGTYASFQLRLLASIIDTFLSSFLLIPLFNVFNTFFGFSVSTEANYLRMRSMLEHNDLATVFQQQLLSNLTPLLFQTFIISVVIIVFWFYRSATPGKMILSMKIVDAKTLQKPSNLQLIARYFGYLLSVLPLCLGFMWIYFDKKKQGFHDKIAGTVVIKVSKVK